MKKITTNAGRVRVIGNLIPDFGEVTSREYYISRNVTHTQTGSLKHLGDDRLIRKMVGSRITTTLTLEATKLDGSTFLFYVRVTPVNSDLPLTGGTVDLHYSDDTYIQTFNLQPVSGSNYAEAEATITLEGQGETIINAEFSGYMLFHSSEATVTVNISRDVVIIEPCTSLDNWTSTNANYTPRISTILNNTCVEAPTGSNPTSFVWSYYSGDAIWLAEHTTIELDAYYGSNASEGKIGLATTNFNLGDHQYRGAGNLKIQRNNALIENHDGIQPNVPQPPINTWFPLKFEIDERQVTIEYTSGSGDPVSTSVVVGQYSSDETLNNTVRLGLQSSAPNYPRIAVKNIVITKHR